MLTALEHWTSLNYSVPYKSGRAHTKVMWNNINEFHVTRSCPYIYSHVLRSSYNAMTKRKTSCDVRKTCHKDTWQCYITNSSQEYGSWNKNVFKSFLKEYIDWTEQTFMGRLLRRAGLRQRKLIHQTIADWHFQSESIGRSQASPSTDDWVLLRHVISKVPWCITL